MRIIYIAKHNSGGNDDEGAITHALTQLGHDVQRVREFKGRKAAKMSGDMLLFHKWNDSEVIRLMSQRMPTVFWYFDLVEWPDDSLVNRNATRLGWMRQTIPACTLGFCTDGDWVQKDTSGKLYILRQGADERIVGRGEPYADGMIPPPLLTTAIRDGGGKDRISFIDEMQICYRHLYQNIDNGVYREDLRQLIANVKIVMAPDSPVTDNYWSNRVYNALGFGAFMMHPYCKNLEFHYSNNKEIVYYHDLDELHDLIRYYWEKPQLRSSIAEAGLEHTKKCHLYRHRCEELIRVVKQRTGA